MVTATRAKKRLGAFLRARRDESGMDPAEAGRAVKVSQSTINRYELGEVKLQWPMVLVLLRGYGCTDEHIAEAERLFDLMDEEPKPVRLPVGTPKAFRKLVSAEQEAVRERALSPYVVPGLLQHERYARALIDSADEVTGTATAPEKALGVRLRRQDTLDRADPLELHAVIDEAVLHREIGGVEVLRDQLSHLLELAARPHITVQVVPFAVGRYYSMNGPVIIVDYPGVDEVPGVYLEYPGDGAWIENPDDVARFTTMFDNVVKLALSPADTTTLITNRVNDLTSS